MNKPTIKDIDALLPQTQCGLCGFKGCLPYAKALVDENASIDLCPPGGVEGLITLAEKFHLDPLPYIPEMEKKSKPPMRAVIRESECIGCTKCIQACPVDAILGASKSMHTVIADECTGCELCIAPCPVDCIDMVLAENHSPKKDVFRKRFHARARRLQNQNINPPTVEDKKKYLEDILKRTKVKNDKSSLVI